MTVRRCPGRRATPPSGSSRPPAVTDRLGDGLGDALGDGLGDGLGDALADLPGRGEACGDAGPGSESVPAEHAVASSTTAPASTTRADTVVTPRGPRTGRRRGETRPRPRTSAVRAVPGRG